jgi:hypothetical protein
MGTIRKPYSILVETGWKKITWKTYASKLNIAQIRTVILILGKLEVENGLDLCGSE